MKLALALGLVVGATSLNAAPLYVGETLNPMNKVQLGFQDTPTDIAGSKGNIAAINLTAGYSPIENAAVRAGLPFYFASTNAVGTSRNALGNINLGGLYNLEWATDSKEWTYGVSLGGDVYFPTSRKTEGTIVAFSNVTTDLYRYMNRATSFTPTLGAYMNGELISAKANVIYGYSFVQKSAGVTDQNRNNISMQAAASIHPLPYLHGNLEYNTIVLDSATRGTTKKFRHSLTPSVSATFDQVVGNVFVNVPLDSDTRDIQNVAFGLNAGYVF